MEGRTQMPDKTLEDIKSGKGLPPLTHTGGDPDDPIRSKLTHIMERLSREANEANAPWFSLDYQAGLYRAFDIVEEELP